MIGKLSGIVAHIDEDGALIDVGGVGYEVFCHARALAQMSEGEAASLIIETHVREDHFHLYGFPTRSEREWFRLLTSVQRVGARMALAIMGQMPPDVLMRAILAKDTSAFSRISGVGPKLAERIVAELKDKAMKMPAEAGAFPAPAAGKSRGTPAEPRATALEDAVSALLNLGYGRSEAYAAAQAAAGALESGAGVDALIRRSLKELA